MKNILNDQLKTCNSKTILFENHYKRKTSTNVRKASHYLPITGKSFSRVNMKSIEVIFENQVEENTRF